MKTCVLFTLLLALAGSAVQAQENGPSPYGALIVAGENSDNDEPELRLDGQYHRLFPFHRLQAGPCFAVQVEDDRMMWMAGGHVHMQVVRFLGVSATVGVQPSDGFDPVVGYAAHLRVLQYLNYFTAEFVRMPPLDLMVGQRNNVTVFGASIGAGSSGE